MSQLHGKLTLHDVRDVEALCRDILAKQTRRWGSTLVDADYEDALAYLIATTWEQSLVYDPEYGISFSNFATQILGRRLVDWYRGRFGDSRFGNRGELVALDEASLDEIPDGLDFTEQILESQAFAEDLALLSVEGKRTVDEIAVPVAKGASYEDVASDLGISRRQVSRRLEDLKVELVALAFEGDPDEIVEALHALPLPEETEQT